MISARRFARLLASISVITLVSGATAYAQTATPGSAQDTSAEADSGIGLADIVVTARKRTERAQDTPISLSVASGETLQQRSVTQFIDVQRQTPSLHIAPSALSATSTNLAMRGQALTDIRLNIDPAVAIYQDGVYLPRAQGSNAADLLDIDRVEVLAGPQGTLYGKNTTGGAVSIYTKTPTDVLEGLVQARYGRFDEYNVAGVLNLPLSETIAVRMVGSISGRDGYGKNFSTGDDTGELNSRHFRAAIKLNPTDRLQVILRGDYTKAKAVREAWKGFSVLNSVAPAGDSTLGGPTATVQAAMELNNIPSVAAWLGLPAADRTALLRSADAVLRSYAQGDPDDAYMNQSAWETAKVWGYSAQIDYDLTDDISFKSITAYRAFLRLGTGDLDGTPFTIIEYPYMRTRDRQISEEAQLGGTFMNGRLNALVGVYYSDERGNEDTYQKSVPLVAAATPVGAQLGRIINKSFGVFSQASFKFTDQFSATAGIRYSKDKRFASLRNRTESLTGTPGVCSVFGVPIAATTVINPATGFPSQVTLADCIRDERVSFSKVNYTASLEYRPTQDIMLYVKTSRGYRSGGLQQAGAASLAGGPLQANAIYQPFKPETVTDYEAGIKSEWFDRRLRVNVTYFHSKLDDAIRNVSTPVLGANGQPTGQVASGVRNAATAKIDGIEFEVTAQPVQALELSVNGAWSHGRFSKYDVPNPANPAQVIDESDLPLLFLPKWQIGVSAAYTVEMDKWNWRNQIDYSYTSKQLSAEPPVGQDALAFAPRHSIVNLRSSIDIKDFDTTIALYGKNVFNKRYIVYPVDIRSLGFIYSGIYNPPATYGIEVVKRF